MTEPEHVSLCRPRQTLGFIPYERIVVSCDLRQCFANTIKEYHKRAGVDVRKPLRRLCSNLGIKRVRQVNLMWLTAGW